MGKIISNSLAVVAIIALFGGFACLIWSIFGAPQWANFWALAGLPVAIGLGSLAGEIS